MKTIEMKELENIDGGMILGPVIVPNPVIVKWAVNLGGAIAKLFV